VNAKGRKLGPVPNRVLVGCRVASEICLDEKHSNTDDGKTPRANAYSVHKTTLTKVLVYGTERHKRSFRES
jgi:hypothetical protein